MRFCCDSLSSTSSACASLRPVLLFFLVGALAAPSSVAPRCLRLGWEACSHTLVFLSSRFDLVVTGGGVGFRGGGGGGGFVGGSRGFGLGAFFEPLGLPPFFLFGAAAGAEAGGAGAGAGGLGGGGGESKVGGGDSKVGGGDSKVGGGDSKTGGGTNTGGGESGTIIIGAGRKAVVTLAGAEDEDILLALSRNLAAFSAVSAAVAALWSALLCFFRIHSSFFVGGGFGSSTGMPALAFVNASCVLVTFFVKLTI